MKTTSPQRVGELRASQLLHTFGIGAITDMPHLSVVIRGLEQWDSSHSTTVVENRLIAALQKKLGSQVSELHTPPHTEEEPNHPFSEPARVGVPVAVFPRWLHCTERNCDHIAPVDSGLFRLEDKPHQPEKTRYVHTCSTAQSRNRSPAVPARFVLACDHGHLDDFPWMYYAHRGNTPDPSEKDHTLKLVERGTAGEAANVFVVCSCASSRTLAEAFGPGNSEKNLPACRGRHPHLGTFEKCGAQTRILALGATNAWFPVRMRAFTLPREHDGLANDVAEYWNDLYDLADMPKEQAKRFLVRLMVWPRLEHYGTDQVYQAILRRKRQEENSGTGEDPHDPLDLAGPEWEAFTRTTDTSLKDFTTEAVSVPEAAAGFLSRVVLGHRLREVSALYGFTRIDAPEFDPVATDSGKIAPISEKPPTWVPCAEQRGEGIFLQFDEATLAAWEQRPAVCALEERLRASHERWRAARDLEPGNWPGVRYVLLHSFAHALIRECALEAGYSAAGIAERIYARDTHNDVGSMAGVLLYTAAPDSEGTLGGLVSLGTDPQRLGTLINQALRAARLCSSDPLCAEHTTEDRARLTGAVCHACLFAAETSCERGNHYLDRRLLVEPDVARGTGAAFIP